MMPQPQNRSNPIVIKKYANRRLYNTDTSSYVTLDDLCQMIKQGEEIIVYDAKNGDDITRSVLTQIIVEQENKGQSLLPTPFLRQLISFYGGNMQGLVPRYLEYTMQAFSKNQGEISEYMRKAMGGMGMGAMSGMFPFSNAFEEMSKQNMAIFEQTMRMFSPFGAAGAGPGAATPREEKPGAQPTRPQAAQAPEAAQAPAHLRPVPRREDVPQPVRQNIADTLRSDEDESDDEQEEDAANEADSGEDDASIRQMKQRLDDLQKQIAALSKDEEQGR